MEDFKIDSAPPEAGFQRRRIYDIGQLISHFKFLISDFV
jgi:hypothetical protein